MTWHEFICGCHKNTHTHTHIFTTKWAELWQQWCALTLFWQLQLQLHRHTHARTHTLATSTQHFHLISSHFIFDIIFHIISHMVTRKMLTCTNTKGWQARLNIGVCLWVYVPTCCCHHTSHHLRTLCSCQPVHSRFVCMFALLNFILLFFESAHSNGY